MSIRRPVSARRSSLHASLCAARAGSFSALGQLLDHYRDYLLQIARTQVDSGLIRQASPSDLVQQTFLQATKGFAKFNGETPLELRAWLRTILANQLVDTWRQQQRRPASLEVIPETGSWVGEQASPVDREISAEERMVRQERRAHLLATMARLPDEYQQVIRLHNFDGEPFETVGVALGRSPVAARQLWRRAIERLGRELSQEV